MADEQQPQANPTGARRYQLLCHELSGEQWRLTLDSTGEGFLTATGTIVEGTMAGEIASAGPRATQPHLALLIANDPELGQRGDSG